MIIVVWRFSLSVILEVDECAIDDDDDLAWEDCEDSGECDEKTFF